MLHLLLDPSSVFLTPGRVVINLIQLIMYRLLYYLCTISIEVNIFETGFRSSIHASAEGLWIPAYPFLLSIYVSLFLIVCPVNFLMPEHQS